MPFLAILLLLLFANSSWAQAPLRECQRPALERYQIGRGTAYSGGITGSVLQSVAHSIDLFRFFNEMPDLKFREELWAGNYLRYSILRHRSIQPETPPDWSVKARLDRALTAAMTGNYEDYSGLVELDEAPQGIVGAELNILTGFDAEVKDWWLNDFNPDNNEWKRAVIESSKGSELLDWLQTTNAAAHAPWNVEWSLQAPAGVGRTGFYRLADHAYARFAAGDGYEWLVAALEVMPSTWREDGKAGDEIFYKLEAAIEALYTKVETCTAVPQELAAYARAFPHALRLKMLDGVKYMSALAGISPEKANETTRSYIMSQLAAGKHVRLDGPEGTPAQVRRWFSYMTHDDERRVYQLYSIREESELITVYKGAHFNPYLDELLNLLPYRSLISLARNSDLLLTERGRLSRVGFTRAYVLGKNVEALSLLPLLAQTNPELADDIAQINQATEVAEREHKLLMFILRTPGLNTRLSAPKGVMNGAPGANTSLYYRTPAVLSSPQQLNRYDRFNWWRSWPAGQSPEVIALADLEALMLLPREWKAYRGMHGYQYGSLDRADDYFRPDDILAPYKETREAFEETFFYRQADFAQLEQLESAPSALQTFGPQVIAWARDTGSVARWWNAGDLPETLYRVLTLPFVQSNPKDTALRYRAHRMLQLLFPHSPWAIKGRQAH